MASGTNERAATSRSSSPYPDKNAWDHISIFWQSRSFSLNLHSLDRSYQLTSEAYLNHPSASRQCTPGSEAPEPAVAAYDPRKEVPAKRLLDQMPL